VKRQDRQAIESELGDVLFALVTVARKHAVDPEAALRGTIERFGARVRWVERESSARKVAPQSLSPEALDVLWNEAKEALRA
jgi:uncharacterized protein YabN with tetrapyrrole methylase and pyrophosphatase domain